MCMAYSDRFFIAHYHATEGCISIAYSGMAQYSGSVHYLYEHKTWANDEDR